MSRGVAILANMERDFVTPLELSRELGVSDRAIRQWLRDALPRPEVEKHSRWQLTPAQVAMVRERFS